jgi:hypothetical protein
MNGLTSMLVAKQNRFMINIALPREANGQID